MPASLPSDRDEISVAVIGCGALTALFYAPALQLLAKRERINVAALIDPVPAQTAAMAPRFPGARCGQGLSDMPSHVDLAIIVSPPGYHAEQTIAMLERGVHVLCEKPMAGTSAECDAMIEAARRADRLLSVGHFKRFFPATRHIKELVETRALGAVRSFRFLEGGKFGWPARSRTFFERRGGQGGVLIDMGAHALDLALWWFGDPSAVTCEDDAMGGVESNAFVRLSYANGVRGEIRLSRDWEMPNRYFIAFERGWVAWDPIDANHVELGWGERYALHAALHERLPAFGYSTLGAPARTRHQSFAVQVKNVLDAVRGHAALDVTGEDGRRVIALIEDCYARSTLIAMPWMSQAEQNKGDELRCAQ